MRYKLTYIMSDKDRTVDIPEGSIVIRTNYASFGFEVEVLVPVKE